MFDLMAVRKAHESTICDITNDDKPSKTCFTCPDCGQAAWMNQNRLENKNVRCTGLGFAVQPLQRIAVAA